VTGPTPRTLVVLPTYNEIENLERAVSRVRGAGYDVLVVDDNSPDGTGDLAARLAAADPGVHLLRRPAKLGLGSAYVAGFKCGLERGYEYLVEMDADGSHRPEHLPEIVGEAQRTGTLAIGSRYVRGGSVSGWGWHRKLLSWGANVYCRTLLGVRVRDVTAGYRCYPRRVLEAVDLDAVMSQGYSFQIEMTYRCLRRGFAVREVPIQFEDRVAGRSKVSEGEVRKALLGVLVLRLRGVGPKSEAARP
jgi:glycosyltransferase involved in cell wall biosynthesis